MASRLFRGIAILFLLYTGAEMTAPQYCNEALSLPKSSALAFDASPSLSAKTASESHSDKDQPSERTPSGDEDCFCCCAHVIPGTAVALNSAPELNVTAGDLQQSGLSSPPLQSPYHPPRSI